MPDQFQPDICVIGAGIIGVATALALQVAGQRVLLVDQDNPGLGCSYGNAGVIASSFVLPLSSPSHLLAVPSMMLDPKSPLSIRLSDLATLAPWLLGFLRNAAPDKQRMTIDALKLLNAAALPSWRRLLDGIDRRNLIIERGLLDIARSPRTLKALRQQAARLRSHGVAIRDLSGPEAGELEPVIGKAAIGASFHETVAHVEDPYSLTLALMDAYASHGGELRQSKVVQLDLSETGVRIICEDRGTFCARQVVVAAGFESARLLRPLTGAVPLGVEHGYHLMIRMPPVKPSRPISFHAESFLATPMTDGLRLAGTVELAKPLSAPNWRRADQLLELASRYIADLTPESSTRWRGGRPSFPDSLPAIGTVSSSARIHYAFGHQHLGLTLAAATAECVFALVTRRPAPFDLEPLSLQQFNGRKHSGDRQTAPQSAAR